ncbi:hypothetical protein [Idiomarina sp.]|uniref:hypothetical protein n=1 Tax=Idiomarina sp. TaxID=1874361 RepID=UPI0025C66945|nr:hypothetical protein [Idiomarina sp.]NQZ03973.1 hypothetical protein [Idiomarina sp.]
MNHKLFVLLLTLVPLLATAQTSDPNQDAKEAQIIKTIEDLRAQRGVEFNYHRESKVGDTTRVEEYLGANEDGYRWQLISENQQAPSKERLEEYRQMRVTEAKARAQEEGPSQSLADLIIIDSLEFIGESVENGQSVWQFSFKPKLDDFSEFADEIEARITYLPKTDLLQRIALKNKNEFSPATSVTVEDFSMEIEFRRFADAYTVPVSMKQNAQGSYLFFKDFHDQTSRTYSDYSLVPSADESNDENELSAAKPCGSSDSKGSRTSSC